MHLSSWNYVYSSPNSLIFFMWNIQYFEKPESVRWENSKFRLVRTVQHWRVRTHEYSMFYIYRREFSFVVL
jgi:hypothetical protein